MLVLSSSLSQALKRSSFVCCFYSDTHNPLSKPLELVHKLPKGTLKIIPILYWRIPMNLSFLNKESPPIEGIPLKANDAILPPRALDKRLQEDWAKDAREGPKVLMSLMVDFGPMG